MKISLPSAAVAAAVALNSSALAQEPAPPPVAQSAVGDPRVGVP